MSKYQLQRALYKKLLRPLLFSFDSESVHNYLTYLGERGENLNWFLESQYKFRNRSLAKTVLGVSFENPIGLSAGFDYDGHLAKVMKHVGFGFNTIGTVTAKPYEGNKAPRLVRLIESKSILVNKGFKSSGAQEVEKRLDKKDLRGHTVGISVGSSNLPE
ncbi:MAG: dihydroorotate dehydrogenase (quinone), partial [bacterium]|nr:dihydroorotate dehydrogenase (quinone) [bacterium]